MQKYKMLIGGEWIEPAKPEKFKSFNPIPGPSGRWCGWPRSRAATMAS